MCAYIVFKKHTNMHTLTFSIVRLICTVQGKAHFHDYM